MKNFYSPNLTESSKELILCKKESNHIKVLRLQENDEINILNGNGLIAKASINNLKTKEISCTIKAIDVHQSNNKIKVFLAPIRHKLLIKLIMQLVELNVSSINFITCKYNTVKLTNNDFKEQLITAIKQSCNPYFPSIKYLSFDQAISFHHDKIIYGSPYKTSCKIQPYKSLSLFIGPEGGFCPQELEALDDKNATSLQIGNYILRSETATIALVSIANIMVSN